MSDIVRTIGGGAILRAGEPDEQQLRVINQRLSRTPLSAEQVYIIPGQMSNTLLDSYLTWMHDSAIETYLANVRSGRGLPMLTQHGTWSFGVGRWFDGFIEDIPAAEVPKRASGSVPLARDVFERKEGPERRLIEIGRIVRGLTHGPLPNDAIVDAVDTGDIDSLSIGATLNPIKAPKANMFCDICDTSMLWRRGDACTHWPGVVYEVDKIGPVMATARYVFTAQREGSLVTMPANDSALIQRAADLVTDGHMDPADARRLEEIYGANILPARFHSLPTALIPPTSASTGHLDRAEGDTNPPGAAPGESTDPAPDADHMDRTEDPMTTPSGTQGSAPATNTTDDVRRFLGDELAAHLEAYRAEGREAWEMAARLLRELHTRTGQRLADQTRMIAERLGQADGEDLAACLTRVDQEREAGRQARGAALEDLVAAYTRAHNLQEAGFDREKYLKRAAAWSLDDIRDEIEVLDRNAKAQLTAGTTIPRTVTDPDSPLAGESTNTPPARPAYNPAFSRA